MIDKDSWWEGPNYLRDSEERWPRNKVVNDTYQRGKEKYIKANQLSETETQVLMDVQSMTMMVLGKFKGDLSRQLSPECYSSWKRYTRVYSWVMRFNNCHVNKEHRMKGELSLDEIRDSYQKADNEKRAKRSFTMNM